jgi:hypothetical protein
MDFETLYNTIVKESNLSVITSDELIKTIICNNNRFKIISIYKISNSNMDENEKYVLAYYGVDTKLSEHSCVIKKYCSTWFKTTRML